MCDYVTVLSLFLFLLLCFTKVCCVVVVKATSSERNNGRYFVGLVGNCWRLLS